MLIWIMVQPGVWDHYVDVYKDAEECQKAFTILVDLLPVYKLDNLKRQRAHVRRLYTDGNSSLNMIFTGCY